MPIDTGLSVPIFNVIKYVSVLIFIDTLVFRSLKTFQHLIRRYDLYYGRSVALESERFDRYNLWNKLSKRNVFRLVFWVVLISCAYAAEILLEFSSDAKTRLVARSEQVNLYNATHRTCTTRDLTNRTTALLVADLATKCIELSDKQYVFYRPTWIHNGIKTPICVRTPDNVLATGEPPYTTLTPSEGSDSHRQERSIVAALRANSWKSNGDTSRAVITIPVTYHDVLVSAAFRIEGHIYNSGTFFKQIPKTNIICGGNVYGRIGEGQMKVQLLGCVHTSSSGSDYTYLSGTAVVFKDAEYLKTGKWEAFVATEHGKVIVKFTQGVIDNPNRKQVRALAALLSIGPGRDIDSVNKYAIAFKHCEEYRVPLRRDIRRLETFPRARGEQVITVSVEEWALATIIAWPMLLWLTALSLNYIANRKGLPDCLQGEKAIARRWLSVRRNLKPTDDGLSSDDSNGEAQTRSGLRKTVRQKCIPFRETPPVSLIVKPEFDSDDIVISGKRTDVKRDRSRPFKAV